MRMMRVIMCESYQVITWRLPKSGSKGFTQRYEVRFLGRTLAILSTLQSARQLCYDLSKTETERIKHERTESTSDV